MAPAVDQSDATELVARWLEEAERRLPTDEQRAEAIGASRPTISGWRKQIRERKQPIGTIAARFRMAIEDFLGRHGHDQDGYDAGLRAAIVEMERTLEELRNRLYGADVPIDLIESEPEPDRGSLGGAKASGRPRAGRKG